MKLGVIGLGSMGMGAALNLVRKGHEVHGCDLREALSAYCAVTCATCQLFPMLTGTAS